MFNDPPKQRKIAWEKWDTDLLEQDMIDDVIETSSEDGEDIELIEEALDLMSRIPKLVTTPAGVFQMHDKMNVLNQFDCWMGHTNFDITQSVKDLIEKSDGVEMLIIISRYRFFIGVGQLFDFRNVRTNIESALIGEQLDDDTRESVTLIKEMISEDKYWAIFVSPAGKIEYASTNDDEDETYIKKLMRYEKIKQKNGGVLFNNLD
tara:strand:+ start:1825 stop:2442 length:618 start_codon:yes stop_codon:yes gene_type:complete